MFPSAFGMMQPCLQAQGVTQAIDGIREISGPLFNSGDSWPAFYQYLTRSTNPEKNDRVFPGD
jgi:hypothetical protein